MPQTSSPSPAPDKPVVTTGEVVAVASAALSAARGGGVSTTVLAAVLAAITAAGLLGAMFIRNFETSLQSTGSAREQVAELQATQRERDALAAKLDAVEIKAKADIRRLNDDHEQRLQAILDAEKAKPATAKGCTVDLSVSRKIK